MANERSPLCQRAVIVLIKCCFAITSDVTQMTSHVTSSPQSTSTTGRAVNRQATPISLRPAAGQSDDQTSQYRHRHRRTHAPTPANSAGPLVSGVTPVNIDAVERVRHSSSTSAVSSSTAGPPPLSLLPSSTAPIVQRRQRHSRHHSSERQQVPADLAANQRSSTDAASSDRLMSTNRDVVESRRPYSAAAAVRRPVSGNFDDEQAVLEHDIATPAPRLHSAAPTSSLYSHPPDVTSSTTSRETRTQSPPYTAATRHKSPADAAGSRHAGSDSYERLNTQVGRRIRRRRRQAADGVGDVETSSPSRGEDADPSVSRRLTMPSIVHYNAQYQSTPTDPRQRRPPNHPPPERPVSAVYVLSDGVRRRLVPADAGQPAPSPSPVYDAQPSSELVELAEPPRRYYLEPAATSPAGGSMVNMVSGRQQVAVWRREDVSVLSEQRRDEIRRQKELDEQQTLVLQFGDFKVTTFMYICSITFNLNRL